MGQWVSMGMSAAQSLSSIMGSMQGMQNDQQQIEMNESLMQANNLNDRNALVSSISQAGQNHSKRAIHY